MSESMTHEQAREALEALALDALDTSERDAAMAHVADCTMCQSELAVLENTANELAYAAAPLPMTPAQRARIRARLMARASTRTGTFMPSPDGEVTMHATHALPNNSPATVAVTDEPEGGNPQPTTAPFLVASK